LSKAGLLKQKEKVSAKYHPGEIEGKSMPVCVRWQNAWLTASTPPFRRRLLVRNLIEHDSTQDDKPYLDARSML